jgi:threonine dehydrogenase-like Zn-dependent dehydrogenase
VKALVWTAPYRMELQEVQGPELPPGWVLLRVKACGVCGSDVSGFLGKNELRRPPLIMGHEFCGVVEEAGHDAPRGLIGRLVAVNPLISCGSCRFCLRGERQLCAKRRFIGIDYPGGLAQFAAAPASACHEVRDEVAGSLVEPIACGVRLVRRAGAQVGDSAVVFGAGALGLIVLMLLRASGLRDIACVDVNEARLAWARRLTSASTVNAREEDVAKKLRELFPEGADIAVDAVGSQGTRLACVSSVRRGGRVVLLGLHENAFAADGNYLVRNEVTVLGSFAYSDEDFARAAELVNSGWARLDERWVDVRPLSSGQETFMRLAEGGEEYPKVILAP